MIHSFRRNASDSAGHGRSSSCFSRKPDHQSVVIRNGASFVLDFRRTIDGRLLLVALIAFIILQNSLMETQLNAQTTHHWNGTSSSWADANGWTPTGPPGLNDFALFDLDITDTILWSGATGNRSIGWMEVRAGDYLFHNQSASTQYELTFNSTLGFSVTGGSTTIRGLHFNIDDSLADARILNGATLNLDGASSVGTRLTVGRDVRVSGNLNVFAGAQVESIAGWIGTGSQSGVATITGAGSQWMNQGGLHIGGASAGTLNILDGATVHSSSARVNTSSGSGLATISDGSQWDVDEFLFLGVYGQGTLNIENGGQVNVGSARLGIFENATGAATVTGIGSQWNSGSTLVVGADGHGILNVDAGGVVSNETGYLALSAGSTGSATVTGNGSQWNNARLYLGSNNPYLVGGTGSLVVDSNGQVNVGDDWFTGSATAVTISDSDSNGILKVRDGGIISNAGVGRIGLSAGSKGEVTISGSGSEWNNTSSVFVGTSGAGTLIVEDGGRVTNTTGFVGRNSGSTGVATVRGPGAHWDLSSSIFVGSTGTGTLNVEEGGLVSNTAGYIGFNSGSTGLAMVTGNDARWSHSSSLYVGYFGSGSLTVDNGGKVANSVGYIGYDSDATGSATITGDGSQWNSSRLFLGGTAVNDGGAASLVVDAGGQVNVGNDLQNGSTTAVTVSDSGHASMTVRNGAVISNAGIGQVGKSSGSSGQATVTGSGSQWNNQSSLFVGNYGNGVLAIEDGGVVSNSAGFVGTQSTATGEVTVTGDGSRWNNSSLFVGGSASTDGGAGSLTIEANGQVNVGSDLYAGSLTALTVSDSGSGGILEVRNGGVVSTDQVGQIGLSAGSNGLATVTGSGSQLNHAEGLSVGVEGSGTLNVDSGGVVSSQVGFVGFASGSQGEVTINGDDSRWSNTEALGIGWQGQGTLNISSGGEVSNTTGYLARWADSLGSATVTGSGSRWNNRQLYLGGSESQSDGGIGELTILNQGQVNVGNDRPTFANVAALTVSNFGSEGGVLAVRNGSVINESGIGYIGLSSGSSGQVTVTGTGSQWNSSTTIFTGFYGNGNLTIQDGGVVNNRTGYVGFSGTGDAIVSGAGSEWNHSSGISVGYAGDGTLRIEDGGLVSNTFSNIGALHGSTGNVTVTGIGSRWDNSLDLLIGRESTGTLNVEAGGVVNNRSGYLGETSTGSGIATVSGLGSQWNHSDDLTVGEAGAGTLNLYDDGLVSVGGTTRIGSAGMVNLDGGRFEFGETSLAEFSAINAISGSMAGTVHHSAYSDAGTLTALQNTAVDLSDVRISNSGTLYGDASLTVGLLNLAAGEVQAATGERLRFAGRDNVNAGELNNFGGQLRFEETLTIQTGGLVSGRGQFIANGGWTNDGVLAFSGGFADVHGDLVNSETGMIAIGGGSTTTFYDDVTMDAANLNIEIASGSYGVFFGSYNGGSTGLGTAQAFGDLRPGNSPAIVSFEGDLETGVNTATFIELGGLQSGQFDQLLVAGNLLLDGRLDVSLIDGFGLGWNQKFLIAEIGGMRTGYFDDLDEGDLVGNYNGVDLFISYAAGDGNDILLFSAVPEPGSAIILGLCWLGLSSRRRRTS